MVHCQRGFLLSSASHKTSNNKNCHWDEGEGECCGEPAERYMGGRRWHLQEEQVFTGRAFAWLQATGLRSGWGYPWGRREGEEKQIKLKEVRGKIQVRKYGEEEDE